MTEIQEKELRIGNLYAYEDGIIDKILHGWMIDEGSTLYSISLTEEILLKVGFEKTTDKYKGYLSLQSLEMVKGLELERQIAVISFTPRTTKLIHCILNLYINYKIYTSH